MVWWTLFWQHSNFWTQCLFEQFPSVGTPTLLNHSSKESKKKSQVHTFPGSYLAQPMLQPQTLLKGQITQRGEVCGGQFSSGMNIPSPGHNGPGAKGGIWCSMVIAPHLSGTLVMWSQSLAAFLLSDQVSVFLVPGSPLTVTGPDKAAENEGLGFFSENLAITIRNLNIMTSAYCNINNFFRDIKYRQTIVCLFLSKVLLMKKFDH